MIIKYSFIDTWHVHIVDNCSLWKHIWIHEAIFHLMLSGDYYKAAVMQKLARVSHLMELQLALVASTTNFNNSILVNQNSKSQLDHLALKETWRYTANFYPMKITGTGNYGVPAGKTCTISMEKDCKNHKETQCMLWTKYYIFGCG